MPDANMAEVNLILQIVLIAAYIVGVIITIIHQRRSINSLKTRIEAQSGLLSDVETVRKILDPKVYKDYVELMESKIRAQADQDKASIIKDMEASTKKHVDYLLTLYIESVKLNTKFIASFPTNPKIDGFLEELPDDFLKAKLIEAREESLRQWKILFPESGQPSLTQLLLQMGVEAGLDLHGKPGGSNEAGAARGSAAPKE